MIKQALLKYLKIENTHKGGSFEAGIAPFGAPRGLLAILLRIRVRACLSLESPELSFTEYTKALRHISKTPLPARGIDCLWFVVSGMGGIYLHEALTREAALHKDGMRHRFIVFNSMDGTVSLGPGNIRNKPLTERMRFLLDQARLFPADVLQRETDAVFGACEQ